MSRIIATVVVVSGLLSVASPVGGDEKQGKFELPEKVWGKAIAAIKQNHVDEFAKLEGDCQCFATLGI